MSLNDYQVAEDDVRDSMLSNPFFSDFEPHIVEALARRSEICAFVPGERFIREGETGSPVYVLQSGSVTVSVNVRGDTVDVAEQGVGALLGEIALLRDGPHTASVSARTAVRALRISRDDFREVIWSDAQALVALVKIVAKRIHGTTYVLANLSFAASALIDGRFDPTMLAELNGPHDEVGRFAGLFEAMANYVAERTLRLEAVVAERTKELTQEIVRRKHAEDELRRLAETDPLTGANNRRRFLELGERELRRARRYSRPLSLLMLDIDNFKQINDAHGHGVGDDVLKRLVDVCGTSLRGQDIFGRLGGEEFAIVLPECTGDAAKKMAERLRRTISAIEMPVDSGKLTFSVSIGVVAWLPEQTLEAVLECADKAMYAAKCGGRDRVVRG